MIGIAWYGSRKTSQDDCTVIAGNVLAVHRMSATEGNDKCIPLNLESLSARRSVSKYVASAKLQVVDRGSSTYSAQNPPPIINLPVHSVYQCPSFDHFCKFSFQHTAIAQLRNDT